MRHFFDHFSTPRNEKLKKTTKRAFVSRYRKCITAYALCTDGKTEKGTEFLRPFLDIFYVSDALRMTKRSSLPSPPRSRHSHRSQRFLEEAAFI